IALFCTAALAAALPARAEVKRSKLVERLDTCEAILQDLQSSTKTAIPADKLRLARGIVIVNQVQAGFLFGVKDGYAVALVRRPNGRWSVPAFLNTGEASLGLQAGIKALNTVLVIMDDATARLLLNRKVNFGAEAKAIAGVRAADAERVTKPLPDGANVLVYTLQEGYYLGAAVKTGYMAPNEEANRVFYNTNNKMPELLYSDWVQAPAEAQFLMSYVTKITN
ncbi:MAG: lipid-binding SYLF domain-containing protein, partial [Opitutales bacterium]